MGNHVQKQVNYLSVKCLLINFFSRVFSRFSRWEQSICESFPVLFRVSCDHFPKSTLHQCTETGARGETTRVPDKFAVWESVRVFVLHTLHTLSWCVFSSWHSYIVDIFTSFNVGLVHIVHPLVNTSGCKKTRLRLAKNSRPWVAHKC